jgi:ribose transport system ATP-binding protein
MDEQRSDVVLSVRGLTKRYGATVALSGVGFEVHAGEVHGLLGENGAGKSTFVKLLSGVVQPDEGEMRVNGTVYAPRSIADARRVGLSTAFQELSLLPTLSVAENFRLSSPPDLRVSRFSPRQSEQFAQQALDEFGVRDISPFTLVGDLSLGERQRLEILFALMHRPRLLLLDEPTAALSDREWLFGILDRLTAAGTAVLYISHKLDEIRRLCTRFTILRNGQHISTTRVSDLSDAEILTQLAGRSLGEVYPERPAAAASSAGSATSAGSASAGGVPALLEAKELASASLRPSSFTLRAGEILGLAALEGQGQKELFNLLFGNARATGGELLIGGRPVRLNSPVDAIARGLALVPEERKSEGVFAHLSTLANVSLPVLKRSRAGGLLAPKRELEAVQDTTRQVQLSDGNLHVNVGALSGGNQQKAILARQLLSGAACLLLFDPTRGIDVGTKQAIYSIMRDFVNAGGAVLFYSTELDEIVHLCDRSLVMYGGQVIADLAAADLTQDRLLALALGQNAAADPRGGAVHAHPS